MDFLELARKRYSARGYLKTPIEDEKLQIVLESACLAPTAGNRQPFQLIIIHTEGREKELQQIYHQEFFIQAPIIICACSIPDEAWVRNQINYGMIDVSVVMDHVTLAAASVGLGTCWVVAFNIDHVREILGIPEDVEPIALTPLGYPADQPAPKERKPLHKLVRYEHW